MIQAKQVHNGGRYARRRSRLVVVAVGLLVMLGLGAAFGLGWTFALSTPIPLVEITQQNGTLRAGSDVDHRCIERPDHTMLCGRLRLSSIARTPDLGVPIRGGYADVPSDSSEGPEPSWLWLTQTTG